MSLKIRIAVSASLALLATPYAQARSIDFYPNGPARIGFGFDPNDPTVIFSRPCIDSDGDPEPIDTQNGVTMGQVEIKQITDRKSLLETLGVSTSMEASYAMVSGSASFSDNVSVSFDQNSLVWIANISVNFGRFRLKNPRAGKTLLDAESPADVLRMCGPEVVTQESRGSVAAVIFEATDVSSDQKDAMAAALKLSYSGVKTSASTDDSLKHAVENLEKTTNINVYTFVQGGPGVELLSKIVANPSDLATIRSTLSDYANGTTPKNAKPLTYETSPITQFKKDEYKTAPDVQQDRLWEIYDQYMNLSTIIRKIEKLVQPTTEQDDYLKKFVPDSTRQSLSSQMSAYDIARGKLQESGKACLTNGPGCTAPELGALPRIEWPQIPEVPSALVAIDCFFGPTTFSPANPQQPKAGVRIGNDKYQVALLGDPHLFKSVSLIRNGTVMPMKVDPVASIQALREGTICRAVQFDKDSAFGSITFWEDQFAGSPDTGRIEIVDVFGRHSDLQLHSVNETGNQ